MRLMTTNVVLTEPELQPLALTTSQDEENVKHRMNQLIMEFGWGSCEMARPERFELPTTAFEARYSIQLSYGRAQIAHFTPIARGFDRWSRSGHSTVQRRTPPPPTS